MSHVLTVPEMYDADRYAMDSGVSGEVLMENAGAGAAALIMEYWDICPVSILCGPGNNGGDGYVIARHLAENDWPVRVFVYDDPDKLTGDAKIMFERCTLSMTPLAEYEVLEDEIVVDALFGAGFKGNLPNDLQDTFIKISDQNLDVVAVDVPSGVNGTTGEVTSGTLKAAMSVSFHLPKTGHLLLPARSYVGRLEVIDIGIPVDAATELGCQTFHNSPELFEKLELVPPMDGHKYSRGHSVICGGGMSSTGAARISATNALRIGAGAVTAVCPPSALMTYSLAFEAVMVKALEDPSEFTDWLAEKRITSCLVGPGNGVSDRTREMVLAALSSNANVVLDADAISVFKDQPDQLFTAIKAKETGKVILTPHEAEFSRLFSAEGDGLTRCREAAQKSGATVLLKGATTVIADPSVEAVLNTNSAPWLATAGSGDALAGIITGLFQKDVDPLLAAAAGAWIHGEAALNFGPGLIAEDIAFEIPDILQDLTEI